MKIVPVQVPNGAPAPTLQAPPPSQSFEDVLTASELKFEERQRAFGFSELGIFRPDSASPHRPARPHDSAPAPPSQEALNAGIAERAAPTIPGTPALQMRTMSGVKEAGARPSLRMAPQQTPLAPQIAAFAPQRQSPPPESGRIGETGSAVLRPAQPQPRVKAFSLTFAEHNGAVQLLAATGGLAPEVRLAVRKAAVEVLAEFGFALGEITLDGQPVEPFTILQTGAFDGDHFG